MMKPLSIVFIYTHTDKLTDLDSHSSNNNLMRIKSMNKITGTEKIHNNKRATT